MVLNIENFSRKIPLKSWKKLTIFNFTKINLKQITKLKARANSSTVTATSMMENGLMTKPTATEFISTRMELSILAFGRMTCNMGSVLRHGRMDPNIRVIMSLEENTALVATTGTTDPFLQEIGKKIKFMELVFINGLTGEVTKVNGAKIIWKVLEP